MSFRPIYLDCHSTTPVDKRVLDQMLPYFTEEFGNPSSNSHAYGWAAQAAVKEARTAIASAINANPTEIVFTSGATEANNLAIKGIAEAYHNKGRHIITVQTEHRAILDPCAYLEKLGFQVTYLPVQEDGLINLEELENAITSETILVSVMTANNEIGVLMPLEAIGSICRKHDVLFHTDAAQAIGKVPLDVEAMHIDLMSLTAHKIYGPKGIGALYVRRRHPKVNLVAQLQGGGQERGLRSGTLYTPQIVGFAKAIEIGLEEQEKETERLLKLRERLWQRISVHGGIYLNGHPTERLPGNLNITIEGVDPSALLLALQYRIAISTGSACSSDSTSASHVLKALGRSDTLARSSLRFGIGRFNTMADIEDAAEFVTEAILTLRKVAS